MAQIVESDASQTSFLEGRVELPMNDVLVVQWLCWPGGRLMKRKQSTEEQIITILKEAEAGAKVG